MRSLPGLIVVLLVSVACAGTTVQAETSSTRSPTTTIEITTTSTMAATTSTLPPGPPVAWIAPNGVPLAVTGGEGDAIQVLTPCGNPATLARGTPLYEVDVVIDPGHGGAIDTGAVAATGLAEKEINLAIGLEVHEILTDRGISAMLTRTGDYAVPIRTRAEYADRAGARALVSIHHNAPAAPASDIPGVEVFVQQGSAESQRLGGLLYEASMDALGQFDVDWDRSPDAGVMTVLNPEGVDAYGMIRRPETPSALIELGYIANRAEAELYQDPAYVSAAALSLADSIETFLTTEEPGIPLVEGRVFRPASGVGADQCVEVDLEESLYPDVIGVEVAVEGGGTHTFDVTMSSPYDSPERYADALRVVGEGGEVYGISELAHDHADEQPFHRSLAGVEIPVTVDSVTVQGRDSVYGWGGGTVDVDLP